MPDALASDDERAAVDAVLGPASSGWSGGTRAIESEGRVARGGHEAREQRHLLLPVLHALQSSAGWISPGGLRYACERLTVPPAEAYGVATFYAMFSVEPRPTTVLHLCDDIACKVAGAEDLIDEVVREAGSEQVLRSPCLGMCERAPAALLQTGDSNDVAFGPVSIPSLDSFLHAGPRTMMSGPEARRSRRRRAEPARGSDCSGASASSIPRRSTTIERTAATRRSGGRSRSDPKE